MATIGMRHINNVVEYGGFIFTTAQYKDLKRLEKKQMYYDTDLFANIFSNDLSKESREEIETLVKQLNDNKYILNDFIVGTDYSAGALQIAVNPLSYPEESTIIISNDELKELTAISNLIKARSDKKDSESRASSTLYSAWNSYKLLKTEDSE